MGIQTPQSIFLVSACLVGLCTRYDGTTRPDAECRKFLQNSICIPVCPEQLGGLPTPRPPAKIMGGDGRDVLRGKAQVVTITGEDVTASFIKGAQQILKLAGIQDVSGVCLKAGSPSCGISGPLGVTAALLAEHSYSLYEF
ncbi:MAG: DUF523 domain-containing protein [Desulfocapsa sp.]|nr:DUF523 domain-containing protein [Desulfocapsa sp.]